MAEVETLTREAGERMPAGCEAAAILLMLLSEEEAADVLARLEPDEVQMLGGAMFGVADVSEGQVNGVLDLFVRRARARTTIGFGADRHIRGMMERALGSDRADNIMARITPPTRTNTLDALKWMDPRTIAALIENEHPQIAALVLAHLDPPIAADVLQLVDEEAQTDLIYRIAKLGPVTSEALEDLERVLLRQLGHTMRGGATSRRGGTSEAAKIVNNTRTTAEQRIIRSLNKLDRTLARTIEDEMFVFDNLGALDEKNMGTLLRAVDNSILVVALKGAEEKLRGKMLGCMSSRAAQSIMDEMIERGPMRLTEVQDAQKEMLAIARQLADAGTINLGGKDGDYV
ncbi:flagellar motor switch protein FliG [Sphingomonas fennica]|uniref:Flagellar motor switch protein FliG n=1 Tax=Edaphosphingomonas fennica TaxID=114404 RepID=A0A2T4I7M7_9SPHN|nr:flagellar motor switch protein FliG [Sphingomonas fennica]PTD27304.1 flagellar motor switch protein FliG [Sphingomonas fennica]